MILADTNPTIIGGIITGIFAFAIAYLTYRQAKQKTDAEAIKDQMLAGRAAIESSEAAMKSSQKIYENASGFSEKQNEKLRGDLDKAYERINNLYAQMVQQDNLCNVRIEKLATEIRELKVKLERVQRPHSG